MRLVAATKEATRQAGAPPAVLEDTLDPELGHVPGRRRDVTEPDRRQAPGRAALRAERLPSESARQTTKRLSQSLFYPPEALAQGLEGEVVLLLETGEGGRIETASVAGSSGHDILDEAALRAVRRMGSLGPAAAGKAILFPVRFRIR